VPSNNKLFDSTVPSNKKLYDGTPNKGRKGGGMWEGSGGVGRGGRGWEGAGEGPLVLGLGVTIKKERVSPGGGKGQRPGRRQNSCTGAPALWG
jgi:hypothetical protein